MAFAREAPTPTGTKPGRPAAVRAAGSLLPVAAIGADGTVVLDDGSITHILACHPPNQESLDNDAVERAFWGLRALAAALERGQVLQLQIEGDLLDTAEHMGFYRRELDAAHGFDPAEVDDPAALDAGQRAAWALYRMLGESVARSAPDGFTMRRRCYLIVRYRPEFDLVPGLADALPAWLPLSRSHPAAEEMRPLRERGLADHRRIVRRALNRVRGFIGHLARDEVDARVLDGGEVVRYLSSRLNPTSATWGRLEAEADWHNVLSRFDTAVERDEARAVARRLRSHLARSPLDFHSDRHHGEVEQDLVRTGYLGGEPASTHTFWLRELLDQPLPFTLAVFLQGLARSQVRDEVNRAWHQAQRENERRLEHGRRDKEAERQEREQEALVEEMAADPQAGLIELSLYLMLRAPGPRADVHELEEAAHRTGQLVHRLTAGGTLMPGTRDQQRLWRSTLPLGVDVARKVLRFGIDHAADTSALIGASCGSPAGLPLLVTAAGEVECLNPFDRAHRNSSIVVAGTSGTGKTNFGNRLVAHLVALGAKGYVFDRAGHYELLAQLIPGARTLRIGAERSRWAINHWDTPDPWDPPKQKIRFLVELHRVMLELDLTRMQEALLAHCIRATYLHCASNGLVPRERELLGFIRAFAEHERERRGGGDLTVQTLDGLAGELAEFAGEGIYAHLWDRETDVEDDAPLLIFDSAGAGDRMLVPLMFATMDWVRTRVRRHHAEAARAAGAGSLQGLSVVLLDEGWAWSQVPELARHIQHWARQSRHYGACFVVMSQDAKDFEGTAEAVLRNASIKLLLQQDPAMLDYLAGTLNLAPEIVRRLKDLRSVKGLYSEALLLNGARGTGRVRLVTGAHEYWAFTSEPHHDQPRRERALAARDGNVWAALSDLAAEGIPGPDARPAA